MLVCGKRGGPSFVQTVRVNPLYYKCPDGYERCSPHTSHSETICMPYENNKRDCPIIDMLVIAAEQEGMWRNRGYQTTSKTFYSLAENTFNLKIAFSKRTSRDKTEGSLEPIISATLNTYVPCYAVWPVIILPHDHNCVAVELRACSMCVQNKGVATAPAQHTA